MINWDELPTCDCQRCKERKKEMDEKIKKLQKNTHKLQKEEASLLKADKKHDKIIAKAKKKMKGC